MALRTFPQYTIRDIYSTFNSNTLHLLLEYSSELDYEEKVFEAKIRGYEVSGGVGSSSGPKMEHRPMTSNKWKSFLGELNKMKSEERLATNLRNLENGL